jgi:hypothetical protein
VNVVSLGQRDKRDTKGPVTVAYLELQMRALGAKISPAASVSLNEHLQEMMLQAPSSIVKTAPQMLSGSAT